MKKRPERRKYERAHLNLLIQYRFETFDEFLVEYSANISEGGMFIRTKEPRAQNSLVYFQFALKDGTKLIEGLGKVVRTSDDPKDPGMGIEFVGFDDESKQMVKAIVDARKDPPGSAREG
jgi:uncharacterized protein (TIGR02266 family)